MEERRYAKGVRKRQEILDAALDVIARHGYHQSTLKDIAAEVGLTNAGVLHYFESKADLFGAVLAHRDAVSAAAADRELSHDADAIDRFVAIVRSNESVPGLVQAYVAVTAEATDPEHGARAHVVARYAHLRRALAEAARARVAHGQFRNDADPELFADLLVAVADGAQSRWLITTDVDGAALVESIIDAHAQRSP